MNYNIFVQKVIAQDSRNRFGTLSVHNGINVPMALKKFYLDNEPVDVEVRLEDLNSIHFYPLSQLDDLQKEYKLPKGSFVFATMNGDPIYLFNNKVFITDEGCSSKPEELASSFDEYLAAIIKEMQK